MDDPNMAGKPGEGGMEDKYTPDEEAQYGKICKYAATHPKGLKMYGYGPMPAASAPSGTNTAIPGEVGESDEEKKKKELMLNASKDAPILYAELESAKKRIAAVEEHNRTLILEREKEKCEVTLNALRADYQFDPAVELRQMLIMNNTERDAHVAYIKANYKPQDQQIQVYNDGGIEGGSAGRPPSQELVDMAVSYASENGIEEFGEALDAVKAGKRPKRMPLKKTS